MTSATDRLRELLDERGVEWKAIGDRYTEYGNMWAIEYGGINKGLTLFNVNSFTPEQAIEATLGRGECGLHDCEGSFTAVNRPVWRCDCGAFVTQYTDATTYHKPRYCPNCGRKVER